MKILYTFENDECIVAMSHGEVMRLAGESIMGKMPEPGSSIPIEPALQSIERLQRAKQQIEHVLSSIENIGVTKNEG